MSKLRLKEAALLLGSNHPDGAYYLAGYSVECGLKACIAKQTQRHDFPEKKTVLDSHTHDLKELLLPAGLRSHHRTAMLQQDFAKNRKIVAEWKAESRYANHSWQEAEDLLGAITDRKAGVLQWIKQYW